MEGARGHIPDAERPLMKIVRFRDHAGVIHHGQWMTNTSARLITGNIFDHYTVTDRVVEIAKLLAPIVPPMILGIGLNYRRHAEETGAKIPDYPVLFLKAANTLNNPGDPIIIPKVAPEQVDYECELAVVIGKSGKNIPRKHALDYVMGYTGANDVSARRWQKQGGGHQWCRGKSFDTFCPLGPCLVMRDACPDSMNLRLQTRLNGETMQDWTTADMIFDVPTLISFLSEGTTLVPGTVILTGTPQGVGFVRHPPVFLKDGDHVIIDIEQIGTLANPVREEQ